MNSKTLCKLLKQRRKQLGFSQTDISIKTNISVSTVCRIDGGSSSICMDNFLAYCKALKLTVKLVDTDNKEYKLLYERI